MTNDSNDPSGEKPSGPAEPGGPSPEGTDGQDGVTVSRRQLRVLVLVIAVLALLVVVVLWNNWDLVSDDQLQPEVLIALLAAFAAVLIATVAFVSRHTDVSAFGAIVEEMTEIVGIVAIATIVVATGQHSRTAILAIGSIALGQRLIKRASSRKQ